MKKNNDNNQNGNGYIDLLVYLILIGPHEDYDINCIDNKANTN